MIGATRGLVLSLSCLLSSATLAFITLRGTATTVAFMAGLLLRRAAS